MARLCAYGRSLGCTRSDQRHGRFRAAHISLRRSGNSTAVIVTGRPFVQRRRCPGLTLLGAGNLRIALQHVRSTAITRKGPKNAAHLANSFRKHNHAFTMSRQTSAFNAAETSLQSLSSGSRHAVHVPAAPSTREVAPHRLPLRERGWTDVLSRQRHGAMPSRYAHQRERLERVPRPCRGDLGEVPGA